MQQNHCLIYQKVTATQIDSWIRTSRTSAAQRTGTSRFTRRQNERHRRLVPGADLGRWAKERYEEAVLHIGMGRNCLEWRWLSHRHSIFCFRVPGDRLEAKQFAGRCFMGNYGNLGPECRGLRYSRVTAWDEFAKGKNDQLG